MDGMGSFFASLRELTQETSASNFYILSEASWIGGESGGNSLHSRRSLRSHIFNKQYSWAKYMKVPH